ncbi:hypothetical protein V3C99_014670, partial [Haemonchus contortus]
SGFSMVGRASRENLHNILSSINASSEKLQANADDIRVFLSDQPKTESPERTVCEIDKALCDANITLKKLISDMEKLERHLLTIGRKVQIGKISDLYPSMENINQVKDDNELIPSDPCPPSESVHVDNVPSPVDGPFEVALVDDVQLENVPENHRKSRRRSRSLGWIKKVVRRLSSGSRTRKPRNHFDASPSNLDVTLPVEQ